MCRLVTRTVALGFMLVALMGFAPDLALAQTPPAATPEPVTAFQVTTIGITGDQPSSAATPVTEQPIHELLNIVIPAGAGFTVNGSIFSALIRVDSGNILISSANVAATISIGTGAPIMAANGTEVLCDQVSCPLEAGTEAMLGPGNGFSLVQDAFTVEALNDETATIQMSVLRPSETHRGLCWICPHITP